MQSVADLLSRLQTRHPLLLFLFLGGALFLLTWSDVEPAPAEEDPTPVVLPAAQWQALRQQYPGIPLAELGAAQLHAVLGDWLDHEVLVREGRRLGLDAGDPIIERRIAQRTIALLEDLHPLQEPDDLQLQAWLREHPRRYGDPPRYTFQQVYLSRGVHGDDGPATATRLLAQLRSGDIDFRALGDPFITGPVVRDITPADLRKHFGSMFADALAVTAPGAWAGPLRSGYGLHLVRVTAFRPFTPWTLENARARIERDYRVHRQEQHQRMLRNRLIEKFGVVAEAGAA